MANRYARCRNAAIRALTHPSDWYARPSSVALGLLLVVSAAFGDACGATRHSPQREAPTSHRTRSIDKAFNGKKYFKEARIQPEQARALALKVFGGEIIYERLEKTPGGSGLRYSFVVRNDRLQKRQVDIDANDGATLVNAETHERW